MDPEKSTYISHLVTWLSLNLECLTKYKKGMASKINFLWKFVSDSTQRFGKYSICDGEHWIVEENVDDINNE